MGYYYDFERILPIFNSRQENNCESEKKDTTNYKAASLLKKCVKKTEQAEE